jgi:hypothetical protein
MSGEQNPRRKAISGARRDKAKGHQTRRARGEGNRKEGKNAISARLISNFLEILDLYSKRPIQVSPKIP